MKFYTREQVLISTPSRKDGIDAAKEQQFRRTYCNFIKQLVKELKLAAWTLETATIFTHRFFAERSIAKNDRFLVAASSVFLACKVDESPRALRDVAYVMHMTKNANKPAELEKLRTNPDAELQSLMDHILLAERALLYTLAFNLNVDHPYTHLAKDVMKLGITDKKNGKEFFQQTVNMLNDSLATTLCLQYEAATLAHAAMHEVAKLSGFNLRIPDEQSFQDYFSITQAELDDIIPQMMSLYKRPKAVVAHPPAAGEAGPLPQTPLPPVRMTGPPLPTFRPIIIQDDGQQQRASARGAGPDSEDGELPLPGVPTPAVAAHSCPPTQLNGLHHASASRPTRSPLVDSDAEDGIGHAPGSGDQNNHNEPDAASAQRQQELSRKRTRSPGGLEEGEIGIRGAKSPRPPAV